MSHITFYRKYRSRNFDEIIGQDHVVQTLKNAILYDRLTHAYIFSGPRGTGKTSMARILAKTLNCPEGHEKDPLLNCALCNRISTGHAVDVIEIDAASNTGVDHMRTLNEQVNFAPVECQYKLYIIDEAHMLSTGAFNALLKTLEEPPQKTLFILATTEPHKIPVTIHSRCQHLYFRSMGSQDITKQLAIIANGENITIDEKSLQVIARNSGGSMRDAVSLLDQVYSFKGNNITLDDVLIGLGATQWDAVLELLEHVLNRDAKTTLTSLHKITDSGVNILQLTSDLTLLVKQLLFVRIGLSEELDLDDDRLARLKKAAHSISPETIQDLLESLAKLEMELRWFSDPKLLLEIRLLMYIKTGLQPTIQLVQPTQAKNSEPPKPAPSQPEAQKPLPSKLEIKPQVAAVTSTIAPQSPPPISPKEDKVWSAFLEKIKTVKQGLYIILNGSVVTHQTDTTLQIKLKQDLKFFREKLMERENIALVEETLVEFYQKPMKISLDAPTEEPKLEQEKNDEKPFTPQTHSQAQATPEAKHLNQIIAMFDGTLV
jgi:DNA polymerase-3 subunit gamma/tau